MFNLDSPRVPSTVDLPSELVTELELLALNTGRSVGDIIMEACASCAESLGWEQEYQEQRGQGSD